MNDYKLTPLMLTTLRKVSVVWRGDGTGERGWYRAESAGERVTLAALETHGYLVRRAWRGDGISRDSAFEYQLALKQFVADALQESSQ